MANHGIRDPTGAAFDRDWAAAWCGEASKQPAKNSKVRTADFIVVRMKYR